MRLARKVQKSRRQVSAIVGSRITNANYSFSSTTRTRKKLESILPQAYAVVVEADRRVLGMEPYFVQILGAIALFMAMLLR